MATKDEEPVVHVLWMNAGLSCDGDSVSLTAATLPSVEDIAMRALPGLPKVQFHWPLVDYQVGSEFMEWFFRAEAGRLDPFLLVVEGFSSQRAHQDRRVFHRVWEQPANGPANHVDGMARSVGSESLGNCGRRHVRYLWRYTRDARQSHRRDGCSRLSGLEVAIEGGLADRVRSRLPGSAGQYVGDAPLFALPGRWIGPHDPAG